MKKFLVGVVVGVLLCAGLAIAVPKDPPRVYVPYKRCECPKDYTVDECQWWEQCQDTREAEWNELIRQINRGHSRTFEAIRGVAP